MPAEMGGVVCQAELIGTAEQDEKHTKQVPESTGNSRDRNFSV
jgi:hypothetical protein